MNRSDARELSVPKPDRPDIPKAYGISRKPKGMLSWEWVDERMANSQNYWICSTRPDGRPHAAPVWGVWVDRRLYFGSDPISQKAVNLRHRADVVVHLESAEETIIMEGTAELTTEETVLRRAAQASAAKYNMPVADGPGEPVHVFTPHKVLAWTIAEFGSSATRWQFDVNST